VKASILTRLLWVLAGISGPVYAAATTVSVSGAKLLVNGQAFTVQGVNYSPTPVGQTAGAPNGGCFGPYQWWTDRSSYVADFPLIQTLGANTIRVFGVMNAGVSASQVIQALDAAQAQHLYVVMGYYIPTNFSFTDMATRTQMETEVLNAVNAYKNHPAVLMWAIGNEVNLNNGNQNASWYSFLNLLAGEIQAIDHNHPVTTVQGECPQCGTPITFQIGVSAYGTTDAAMTHLDLWSVTAYRGPSFQGLFSTLTGLTSKPIFVAEFGKDAYRDATGAEDQTMQSDYLGGEWSEINANLSASGAGHVIGGAAFEWTDEWWKDAATTNCFAHGAAIAFARPGDTVDPNYNEEWFGLASVLPVDAVNNKAGTARNLRKSFFTLQASWNPAASQAAQTSGARSLFQDTVRNFPNPFRLGAEGTKFVALTNQPVSLEIDVYDAGQQLVTKLHTSSTSPGRVELNWDGRNNQGEQVSAGLYFARIEGKGGGLDEIQFRKVVAVR
jgi:hypothetical protein